MRVTTVLKSAAVMACTFIFATLLAPSAQAGRKNPLNSVPPEVSNSSLCIDQSSDENLKLKREDFCKLTNSIREWHLTHTLKLDSSLNDVAQLEAKLIYEVSNREKDESDAAATELHKESGSVDLSSLLIKLKKAGLEVGELGFHISTIGLDKAHDVIRRSLASPKPRKKFLGKTYRKVGVGFYQGVWISLFTD